MPTIPVLLLLVLLSAGVTAAMTRLGALDHPVARSSHTNPTPKGGGVGIVAAFAVGMAPALLPGHGHAGGALTVAGLFLAGASYLDDVRDLRFWLKLAAQLVASAAVVAAGLAATKVALPGWGTIHLGAVGACLSLAWMLYVTNAVNFMDGLNGLAAGSVAVGCAILALAAGARDAWPECLLAAGIAGFLPFNFPIARIFMGDVGSQFIGFLIAGLSLAHIADPRLALIMPFSLMPVVLDTSFTLARRWYQGDVLTRPHRGHLYQLASRAGVKAWLISLIYWGLAGLAGVAGLGWGEGAINGTLCVGLAVLPFIAWAEMIIRRARMASIGAW